MKISTALRVGAFALFIATPLIRGQSNPCVEWNLAHDFAVSPNQANPNPDGCGNADVWNFLESDSATFPAHIPAIYTLLPEFITDDLGVEGLDVWQGNSGGTPNLLPLVGINHTGSFQAPLGINWPADVILVHPWFDRLVIVGWKSPITGLVTVSGGVEDVQFGASDGIGWSVDYFDGVSNTTLASGSVPEVGAQKFQDGIGGANLAAVWVNPGDMLYFVVDPLAWAGGDSTRLDIVITPTGTCGGIIGSYCSSAINSTGKAAHMGWFGSTSLAQNDFALTATDCPPNHSGIFFMGLYQTQIPFGEGYLCVTGNQQRFPKIVHIDGSGFASYALGFDDPHSPAWSIAPGSQWNLQFWYRDPQPVGHGFNFTDALAAQFCP